MNRRLEVKGSRGDREGEGGEGRRDKSKGGMEKLGGGEREDRGGEGGDSLTGLRSKTSICWLRAPLCKLTNDWKSGS